MKQNIFRNWRKYLAVILLPVLVWCTVFSIRSKPKRNELLRVLYVGEGLDTAALQQELTVLLPALKELAVTQELPQGRLGGDWLTYRQFAYDILIFSEPYCTDTMGQQYFSRLPDTLTARFSGVPTYTETVEDTALTFALRLDGTETHFADNCEPAAPCLLFFSPESVNLGGENGKGNETDDAALVAAQYLLEAID